MIELVVVLSITLVLYYVLTIIWLKKRTKGIVLSQGNGGVIVEKSTEEYKLKLDNYTDYVCGTCKELTDSTHPLLSNKMGFKECKKHNCMIHKESKFMGYVKCCLCFKNVYNIEKIYLKQDIEKLNQVLTKENYIKNICKL